MEWLFVIVGIAIAAILTFVNVFATDEQKCRLFGLHQWRYHAIDARVCSVCGVKQFHRRIVHHGGIDRGDWIEWNDDEHSRER